MLGVYMQRSWVILFVTGLFLMLLYIFATPLLLFIGQTEDISQAAGQMALWMIPQLFAYAFNYPIAKFLQAQSKIMVMAYISAVALVLHTFFSWLLMLKLGWGLWGGALVLNLSWWFMVVAQMIYILSGTCGRAWSGFSWEAFSNLWSFVKLSLASAIMLCLEVWYFMALILFAGYIKNAEIAVDALSICMNILGWAVMASIGFNAAISVRVSNELGAAHPRTAKFSIVVVVISAFLVGVLFAIFLVIFRNQYPALFADSLQVQQAVYALTPLLAACLIINNIQPALSGVAIGAGWQAVIAYINIACYYIFGIPLGLTLGFAANWGVKGIWMGMLTGTVVQTVILVWICYRTNWDKEASMAEKRIRKWSGQKEVVGEVMELVELDNIKDAIVGLPGVSGLSTEQRKRLTIAVELVANPSIIFMDEPTSGLDARAAAIVMRAVRNTVDTGRTVVCTIHQPSIDIFESFDELLLLKRGGKVIYAGPLGRHSQSIIDYFEEVPGVPKIPEKYNPATWMLEVSSGAAETRLNIDFAEHYSGSSLHQRNKEMVKELSVPPPGAVDLHFETQYSQSMWGQFTSCLWKMWWSYWRNPDYNLVRFFFTLLCALMVGTVFWKIGNKKSSSNDLSTTIGAMYAAIFFVGINNSQTVQPVVATERTVFYRERAAGMYSSLPYAMAQVFVEIPYVFIQTTYYTCIVYTMVSFEWTAPKFFWLFFINFFSFLYFTYYGMMTVSITPNEQIAAIFAAGFYLLFNIFSGFYIPQPKIPGWWVWYYWICPMAWTVYGCIVSQYHDVDSTITVPGMATDPTLTSYLNDYYGFEMDFMGPVAAVLIGFCVFFAFLYATFLRTMNFQMR